MAQPLCVYTFIPHRQSASHYYRIRVACETARDLGLPVRFVIDSDSAAISPEARIQQFCEADIALLYQPIGENVVHNATMAKALLPSKRDGSWKYPVSVVIDTDDNLFNVTPHNVAFRHLGWRDERGREIPVSSDPQRPTQIGVVEDGRRRVLWTDGEDGFSLARNRQTVKTYRQMIELAEAVTCSTPHVADCVRRESHPRHVEVFPNLVRFDHYPQVKLAPQDRVNILWQGGASHFEDWHPLKDAMTRIVKKYSNVHITIWGQLYQWVFENIPADRYTFMPWCAYEEYKLRLCMIGHDINLAPLHKNVFNECRSAIKFYESSVLEKPAATLAQNNGPYRDEILRGETGLLFDDPEDFFEKLSTLIEDATYRKTLASNAKDWVSQNRDAMKRVPLQVAFWERLRSKVSVDYPHMPDGQWAEFEKTMMAEPEKEPVPV